VISFCSILIDDDDEKKEISSTKTTNGKGNKDLLLVVGFCIDVGLIVVVVVDVDK
jgi:hypothetical protein